MIILKRALFPAITLVFLSLSGVSQSGKNVLVSDFEGWAKAGVNIKLNKNWSFGLEEQLRLKSNASEVDAFFTELNAKYKMKSGLYFGAGFRFIRENDNEGKIQGYETQLRYNFDAGYKHSIDRLKLGYRLRFQSKNEIGSTADVNETPTNVLRTKVGGDYNIKGWKFDPKLSFELFNRFGEDDVKGLSKFRTTIGTSYDLKKYGDIGLFYRLERELNPTYVDYPKTTYIVGLSYIYTIKIKTNE